MCDSMLFLICSRFVPDKLSGTHHTSFSSTALYNFFLCSGDFFTVQSKKRGWGYLIIFASPLKVLISAARVMR